MRLYNTLTRQTDELTPAQSGRVRIYCCGPTVYDVPHAGHARAAIAPDVLVRHLRAHGLEVTYVRNVTDVDDKILERSKQNGESPLQLSSRMAVIYDEQMRAIGCLDPNHAPKVSEHLSQVIALVESLVRSEHAYVVDRPEGTRDVYYAVRSFPGYGKLSRRRIDELVSGARVEKDETKRDPLDFALWKGAPEGEWGWPSPWGRGRPGWHIECSAMSSHYLGHGFDVHAGGMDLIFPHHENEIAQSEAACPDQGPFARIWMHNGFINVDKEKMSKSLGNFVTVSDVLERNDPEGFRWFLLGVHYRGPIQFETEKLADGRVVFPGVDEAERRVDYMYESFERLAGIGHSRATAPARLPPEIVKLVETAERAAEQGLTALDDDLNTPVALASLGEIARVANEICDLAVRRKKDVTFLGSVAVASRRVLLAAEKLEKSTGVMQTPAAEYARRTRERRVRARGLTEADISAKVAERTAARAAKDWARADALRAELASLGISVHDGTDQSVWSIAQ